MAVIRNSWRVWSPSCLGRRVFLEVFVPDFRNFASLAPEPFSRDASGLRHGANPWRQSAHGRKRWGSLARADADACYCAGKFHIFRWCIK